MNPCPEKTCPRCLFPLLGTWDDLTDEQKLLVERLPASADFPLEQRKKHRFCTRCLYEEIFGDLTA